MKHEWIICTFLLSACGAVNAPASGAPDAGPADASMIDAMPGMRALRVDVTGLSGTLVLQNQGGNDLTVTADGTHRFSADVPEGATYAVDIASDPVLQNCHVTGGSGTVGGTDIQVAVRCVGNVFMWIDDNPDDSQYNHEIWMTDHTAAGTARSVNIHPDDTIGSGPSLFTRFGSFFYLVSNDGSGAALFRTDGTQAGTLKLRNFTSVTLGSGGLVHNGAIYFAANGDANGTELWRYDGTSFTRLTDLVAGSGSAAFGQDFWVLGTRILFTAQDANGSNPWAYDIGTGSAALLSDCIPGPVTGQAGDLVVLGAKALFSCDSTNGGNNELWSTDGTPAGTALLKEIRPGTAGTQGSFPLFLGVARGKAYFRANDGVSGQEIWVTDGTAGGTTLLRDINPAGDSGVGTMVDFGGKLWFTANDGNGRELWSTDGTTAGTTKLEVNASASVGSNPFELTVVGTRLYFGADGGDGAGVEIWSTDGATVTRATEVGTDVGSLGPYDGRVLYFFNGSYDTTELWSTDGTIAGTQKVKDLCAAAMCNPFAQFVRITR